MSAAFITPSPQEVRVEFARLFARDPQQAVSYLYDLSCANGYIQTQALARTMRWSVYSAYGPLEVSINLAKPEKEPFEIAKAARQDFARSSEKAPLCDLCWENEMYPGDPGHPAKPGLRIAALTLGGERWGLQYSPYGYFPEHCIALSAIHRPMCIDGACFERLCDFVDAFPFYFIGSNADLPLVGGSILSHDHFQGGRYVFPLMKAPLERVFSCVDEPAVQAGIVRWAASVVRLESRDRAALVRMAKRVLDAWQNFSCEPCDIVAADEEGQHNTLNPIVRKVSDTYVMDLVLRNNRRSAAHPDGIFHPDKTLHHIKKENIGLIEIMGLAILPPRLARELPALQQELVRAAYAGEDVKTLQLRLEAGDLTAPHSAWAQEIFAQRASEFVRVIDGKHCASSKQRDGAPLDGVAVAELKMTPSPGQKDASQALHPVIRDEVGRVFERILETCGVFKQSPQGRAGWDAFLDTLQ